MAEMSANRNLSTPAEYAGHEPSPECQMAVSTLIKLPAELRALIFELDITEHISSSYTNLRSPLCLALADLAKSSRKSHQILHQQSLAAWDKKERRTFLIRNQDCASSLNAKKRIDRLAIQHLVFDLEDFYHIKVAASKEGPLIQLRGHKITSSSNLKTICFRARAPFLKLCLEPGPSHRVPTPDINAPLQCLVPAAARTLEKIVIEIPAQDHADSTRSDYDDSDDKDTLNVDELDYWLGAGHEKMQNPGGDWFLVWSAPFTWPTVSSLVRRTGGYKLTPISSLSKVRTPFLSSTLTPDALTNVASR